MIDADKIHTDYYGVMIVTPSVPHRALMLTTAERRAIHDLWKHCERHEDPTLRNHAQQLYSMFRDSET